MNIVGVDINESAIDKARNIENIEFHLLDEKTVNKYNYFFDFIYSSHVFEHIRDRKQIIKDIIKMIKIDKILKIEGERLII